MAQDPPRAGHDGRCQRSAGAPCHHLQIRRRQQATADAAPSNTTAPGSAQRATAAEGRCRRADADAPPHHRHRYVTVISDHGFAQRRATAALSRAPQGTATAPALPLRRTAGRDRGAGRMRCAPWSTSRVSTRRGSTTCPTIFGSPPSLTAWRRFAALILPNWRASSRRAGSVVTEGTRDCPLRPSSPDPGPVPTATGAATVPTGTPHARYEQDANQRSAIPGARRAQRTHCRVRCRRFRSCLRLGSVGTVYPHKEVSVDSTRVPVYNLSDQPGRGVLLNADLGYFACRFRWGAGSLDFRHEDRGCHRLPRGGYWLRHDR